MNEYRLLNFVEGLFILIFGFAFLSGCAGFLQENMLETTLISVTPSGEKTDIVTQTPYFRETTNPTLAIEYAIETVTSLFSENGGCEIPCWWGFTPGETSWIELKKFIDSIASETWRDIVSRDITRFIYSFPFSEDYPYAGQNYYVQDELLILIETYPPLLEIGLAHLLQDFGEPTQVLIETQSRSREFSITYRVALYYPEKGILAQLGGEAEEEGENIKICPQERDIGFLMLWSPEREIELDELLGPEYGFGDSEGLMSLSVVSNWDEEIFHENFSNPETDSCIITPKFHWSP